MNTVRAPGIVIEDGIHMNHLGYLIWRNVLRDVVQQIQADGAM